MSWLQLLCGFVLVLFVHSSGDPSESLPGVIDLTPTNFDQYVNGVKSALVEFYAPWCGHCKRMTPEFKKLGEALQNDPKLGKRVVIGKVNADEHKELSQRFGVTGFPTIKWFGKGKPVSEPESYQSARTADKFLEFINEQLAGESDFARVESMDKLAKKFVQSSDKKGVVEEAVKESGSLTGDDLEYAQVYIKMMKKALEKGVEYFSNESKRLERMVASGNVNKSKLEEMLTKLSVLSAFLPEEVAEE
eukprot:TRINITY_DN51656_c0_g2_i6.p2 TRINITY_DN51656_c0_g2~~TRINITY_DN51656_c0_g2_i6.p2  ORF type:complete len:248 (-),score=46.00 TRINITY_DN51656_c0_g2_i6:272-1015(-)